MPEWNESTRRRLRSSVFQTLAQAGFIESTKTLTLQTGPHRPSGAPLDENKIAAQFAEVAEPDQHDLVILSGVGSGWPLLRSHTLLNNLHPIMGRTPLVMFYPGRYDGQSLRLFGKLKMRTTIELLS